MTKSQNVYWRDPRSSLPAFSPDWRTGAAEKLMSRLAVAGNGCWEYQGAKTKKGYGSIGWGNAAWPTHRLMMISLYGNIGASHVLHDCDNPSCCNPAHLRLGTAADNAGDRAKRGRNNSIARAGSNNGNAKLTEDAIREIRATSRNTKALADRFGVTTAAIKYARQNTTWRHI